ncbi:MAG TPA: hypothetical protein VF773_10805 [Verrucomicrobiae bacterium]
MSPAQTLPLLATFVLIISSIAQSNFVNFETAPVNPIALSPDGKTLALCNLPAARVEFFAVSNSVPALFGVIQVGVDPVTVRFRTDNEVWVVNTISDSINVIDLTSLTLQRVISTRDGPADVVFAGNPPRAFVSCPPENLVQVFHPETGTLERTIPIKGERPKALAVSPDGQKVYAAILESGNGTTIVAPRVTDLGHVPAGGPVDLQMGPYGGVNPPPNSGTNFIPAISATLSNPPPRVSMIVKKQADGRWLDDNNGDWSELVTGTNAPLTGRVQGWDLLDHDIAVIDASTFQTTYATHLMNICFNLAVNPEDGTIAMIGTDALNHIRFEPVLQSIFTRVQLALVNSSNRIADLNPHLDYQTRTLPLAERSASLGDPRAVAWNRDGSKLYVAGMGSDNVVALTRSGERTRSPASVPAGPVGLAVDPTGNRLFVLSRFEAALTVLDADSLSRITTIPLFDPTPENIRKGRAHFYNTHKNSGLGQASCASCHVDGKFDRLAWDLGSQLGEMRFITRSNYNFGAAPPAKTNHFHPMKGPMVTQTLQDIIGHEPFHWRGDRLGIEEFNPTFEELQGGEELSDVEMQEFEDFLASIHFPPNRFRQFDNSLPRSLPLPGQTALGRGTLPKGAPLPNGDAVTGLNHFRTTVGGCTVCHSLPAGLGSDKFFQTGLWRPIPPGPNGERHVALSAVERSHELAFKIPHLRSLPEKFGFSLTTEGTAGFGFFHDGRVDSLTRVLQDGFFLENDKQTADLIAFMLAFTGSDLPTNSSLADINIAPGDFSRDVAASVGRQLLLDQDNLLLEPFVTRARSPTGRVDLIVKARVSNAPRGWMFDRLSSNFRPDAGTHEITRSQLFATPREGPLIFTLVPRGSGVRLGIDSDEDGIPDFDDASQNTGSAADHPQATISLTSIHTRDQQLIWTWHAAPGRLYRVLRKNEASERDWRVHTTGTTTHSATTNSVPLIAGGQSFFRIELLPE